MAISISVANQLAIDADHAWQRKLKACGIDRYSSEAKGEPGTVLRNLYEAKVYADEMVGEAFARAQQ